MATTTDTAPAAALSEAATSEGVPRELAPPRVQLNVEIHIPADASAAQIDQTFSSMARHIKANLRGGRNRDLPSSDRPTMPVSGRFPSGPLLVNRRCAPPSGG